MLDNTVQYSRNKLKHFLSSCLDSAGVYSLTPKSDASGYAQCFGMFLNQLLLNNIPDLSSELVDCIVKKRSSYSIKPIDKPYRQLLTFTLSSLSLRNDLNNELINELVREQIPDDIEKELQSLGCLNGKAGSGNQAMFLAIFLIHARDFMNIDTQSILNDWVELHLESMNRNGFWGEQRNMTHLQFQNGYHQYEIFEYLGVKNPLEEEAIAAVHALADSQGHFAPYPGGGGCFDYDAIFILTPQGRKVDVKTRELLERTLLTLSSEQQSSGGFAESLYVRPRNLSSILRFIFHVANSGTNLSLLKERLRYGLTLQRPKHNRIHTHWSNYSRQWSEADLWDSWFRMLTIARIETALDPRKVSDWGFINYPGIGYHPLLNKG